MNLIKIGDELSTSEVEAAHLMLLNYCKSKWNEITQQTSTIASMWWVNGLQKKTFWLGVLESYVARIYIKTRSCGVIAHNEVIVQRLNEWM